MIHKKMLPIHNTFYIQTLYAQNTTTI